MIGGPFSLLINSKRRHSGSPPGFCGGYTTFSAASFETVRLAERGQVLSAVANGVSTLLLAVSAAAAGLILAGG